MLGTDGDRNCTSGAGSLISEGGISGVEPIEDIASLCDTEERPVESQPSDIFRSPRLVSTKTANASTSSAVRRLSFDLSGFDMSQNKHTNDSFETPVSEGPLNQSLTRNGFNHSSKSAKFVQNNRQQNSNKTDVRDKISAATNTSITYGVKATMTSFADNGNGCFGNNGTQAYRIPQLNLNDNKLSSAGAPSSSRLESSDSTSHRSPDNVVHVRQAFDKLRDEFGRVSRISYYTEHGPAPVLGSDGTLCVTKEELAALRSLNSQQMLEMWESECLRRKLCERKIELLQKRLLETEELLVVRQSLNDETQSALQLLEQSVNELLTQWIEKERTRIEQCTQLMQDNTVLSDNLQRSMKQAEQLQARIAELETQAQQRQTQLDATATELEKITHQHKQLSIELERTAAAKEKLLVCVEKLQTEKLAWFEKEQKMFQRITEFEQQTNTMSQDVQTLRAELKQTCDQCAHQLEQKDDELQKKMVTLNEQHNEQCSSMRAVLEEQYRANYKDLKQHFANILNTADQNFIQLQNENKELLKKVQDMDAYKKRLQHQMVQRFQSLLSANYEELLHAVKASENSKFDVTALLAKSAATSSESLSEHSFSIDNRHANKRPVCGDVGNNLDSAVSSHHCEIPQSFLSAKPQLKNDAGRTQELKYHIERLMKKKGIESTHVNGT